MEGIRLLRDGMRAARNEFTDEADWRNFIATRVRPHPALCLAHEDPFIRRAFAKPRGYAGDAVLLDFIYHHPANRAWVATAPPRGRAALGFSTNTPAPRAVRNRAWLLANEIDAVCARAPRAAILSMACGHLREARDSCALEAGAFGRFVALDQDVESLEVVRRDAGPLGVEAMEGSVKTVIARGPRLGSFDFIYAAGLFDYLNDRVAARLLCTLAGMLKRGGKLWVANFLPGIVDRGFMESFMDWWLIYRTPRQMLEIADALPPGGYSSRRTFVEIESNIVFLEVRR
ncbi:MAG: class I SAM-dependent methyltransferase [Acidobacteria bacterium]|nr:class I SAM-dependent methyltransferase [Acidobacteriota bacterium]